MIDHAYQSIECEVEIGKDGTLTLPPGIGRRLPAGERIILRFSLGAIKNSLRRRRVSEDEVERIALTQLERRENVIQFLESEGALAASRSFAQRAAALLQNTA